MTLSFDTDLAKEYGLNEAIILNNLAFWVMKNAANEKNFFEGRYWTYNSTRAWQELFPFMTNKMLRLAITHLKDEGLILTGNFNEDKMNHTTWYTLSDKGIEVTGCDLPYKANRYGRKGQIIYRKQIKHNK